MRKNLRRPLSGFILFIGTTGLNAQVLYQENFETSPVTSILNIWNSETQLTQGPSPCGLGSRGTTADFNSLNVNFNNSQNSGYFLAVNPQSPCGGFYNASLRTGWMNFSGQDSLRFSCRYFKSTTLNWGPSQLEVIFTDGSSTYTVNSQFTVTNNWASLSIGLPSFLIAPTVRCTVNMGGGEGVGIDSLRIENIPVLSAQELDGPENMLLYPNPASGELHIHISQSAVPLRICNSLGQTIMYIQDRNFTSGENSLDISGLEPGVYYLELKNNNRIAVRRFVVH